MGTWDLLVSPSPTPKNRRKHHSYIQVNTVYNNDSIIWKYQILNIFWQVVVSPPMCKSPSAASSISTVSAVVKFEDFTFKNFPLNEWYIRYKWKPIFIQKSLIWQHSQVGIGLLPALAMFEFLVHFLRIQNSSDTTPSHILGSDVWMTLSTRTSLGISHKPFLDGCKCHNWHSSSEKLAYHFLFGNCNYLGDLSCLVTSISSARQTLSCHWLKQCLQIQR